MSQVRPWSWRARGAAVALSAVTFACDSKPESVPEGGAIRVYDTWIDRDELDRVAAFLLEGLPTAGLDTARAAALEGALIPRVLAQRDFKTGVEAAREKARVAMAMIRGRQFFEDARRDLTEFPEVPIPVTGYRKHLDPILGTALFGKPAGAMTPEPVETSFSVVIARVDMPIPEPGPLQEQVLFTPIEFYYDITLTDINFRKQWAYRRMREADYAVPSEESLHYVPAFLIPRTRVLTNVKVP